jgi:hypothetical protein
VHDTMLRAGFTVDDAEYDRVSASPQRGNASAVGSAVSTRGGTRPALTAPSSPSSSSASGDDTSSASDDDELARFVQSAVDAFVAAADAPRESQRSKALDTVNVSHGSTNKPRPNMRSSIPRSIGSVETSASVALARASASSPAPQPQTPLSVAPEPRPLSRGASTHSSTNAHRQPRTASVPFDRNGFLSREEVDRRAAERRQRIEAEVRSLRPFCPSVNKQRIKMGVVVPAYHMARRQRCDPYERNADDALARGTPATGVSAQEPLDTRGASRTGSTERNSPIPPNPRTLAYLDDAAAARRQPKPRLPSGWEERLYDVAVVKSAQLRQEMSARNLDYRRRKLLEDELECTFSPVINDPTPFLSESKLNVTAACRRLHDRAERARKRQLDEFLAKQRAAEQAAKSASMEVDKRKVTPNATQARLFRDAMRRQGGKASRSTEVLSN